MRGTSRQYSPAGRSPTAHPNLRGSSRARSTRRLRLARPSASPQPVVFSALPHGATRGADSPHWRRPGRHRRSPTGSSLVDLSGDFRLADPGAYRAAYGSAHPSPEHLGRFVYGLPEWTRAEPRPAPAASPRPAASRRHCSWRCCRSRASTSASSPPRASPARPAAARAWRDDAPPDPRARLPGLQAAAATSTCRRSRRRSARAASRASLAFVPQSAPLVRGIFACLQFALPAGLDATTLARREAEETCAGEPFLRLVEDSPRVAAVAGSNFCDIAVAISDRHGVVMVAFDNLVKGMAGQAVQCMNLALGISETTGLRDGWRIPWVAVVHRRAPVADWTAPMPIDQAIVDIVSSESIADQRDAARARLASRGFSLTQSALSRRLRSGGASPNGTAVTRGSRRRARGSPVSRVVVAAQPARPAHDTGFRAGGRPGNRPRGARRPRRHGRGRRHMFFVAALGADRARAAARGDRDAAGDPSDAVRPSVFPRGVVSHDHTVERTVRHRARSGGLRVRTIVRLRPAALRGRHRREPGVGRGDWRGRRARARRPAPSRRGAPGASSRAASTTRRSWIGPDEDVHSFVERMLVERDRRRRSAAPHRPVAQRSGRHRSSPVPSTPNSRAAARRPAAPRRAGSTGRSRRSVGDARLHARPPGATGARGPLPARLRRLAAGAITTASKPRATRPTRCRSAREPSPVRRFRSMSAASQAGLDSRGSSPTASTPRRIGTSSRRSFTPPRCSWCT